MTVQDLICPKAGRICRHAGYNYQVVRTEKQKHVKSILGPRLVADHPDISLVPDERGIFCNDEQRYVSDIEGCPHTSCNDTPAPIIERYAIPINTRQATL
jgi:hypothetical protein